MSRYYVVCELGAEIGRVMMGTLHQERLTISELDHFPNVPVTEKDKLSWNIPELYQRMLEGLGLVGAYDEPVESISCTSWGADYLLFEPDGTLITPAFHFADRRTAKGTEHVLSKIPWDTIYSETGNAQKTTSTLYQLGAESSGRLKAARHLLPIADAFNFLLSGVPRAEMSLASATQLFNPVEKAWSSRLLGALRLPPTLMPPLVPAGTDLGPLRPELAKGAGLQEARVLAACSHELAAALAGLPLSDGEIWAFLRPGISTLMGTQMPEPILDADAREGRFSNQAAYDGSTLFYTQTMGFWLLEECQRFWKQTDHDLDPDMLGHLAGSATPFESLIDPSDPRFREAGDMPLKIQAFCKETRQPVPRKPGPIYRCILESLALHHRRLLHQVEHFTGAQTSRLFVLGSRNKHNLIHHFTANALQLPVVVAHPDSVAIGNVVVQALALGHLQSLQQARAIIRNSFKTDVILPHATAWNEAYERLLRLSPEASPAKSLQPELA